MKNQIEKILIIVVVIVLVPQIALASFWNPFSWFKNSNQTIEVVEPTKPVSTDKNIETIPKKITEPKNTETEKPVVKVVEKIVTVPDSTLQERIRVLELENQQLKLQLEKLNALQKQVQLQKQEIESLRNAPVFSKENECKEAKEIISAYLNKATDLIERKNKELTDYDLNHQNQPKYQKDIDAIKNKYNAEGRKIDQEKKSAETKVQIYCD